MARLNSIIKTRSGDWSLIQESYADLPDDDSFDCECGKLPATQKCDECEKFWCYQCIKWVRIGVKKTAHLCPECLDPPGYKCAICGDKFRGGDIEILYLSQFRLGEQGSWLQPTFIVCKKNCYGTEALQNFIQDKTKAVSTLIKKWASGKYKNLSVPISSRIKSSNGLDMFGFNSSSAYYNSPSTIVVTYDGIPAAWQTDAE